MDLLELLRNALPALTSGANQPQTPPQTPDMAGGAAPMNANIGVQQNGQGYPTLAPFPTPEQMQAQSAPYRPEGQSIFGHIMNALAPVPEATAGMLSPQDQRMAQMRAVSQLLGGAVGAYYKPGEQHNFAVNLARGISASHESMDSALQASQSAANLQSTNAKVRSEQMANAINLQTMRQYPPSPGETEDQYIERMAHMASMLAPTNPQGAAAIASVIHSLQDNGRGGAATAYAPKSWHDAYDKAHPEPPQGTPQHAVWAQNKQQAAGDAGFGGTALNYSKISGQETRQGNFGQTMQRRDIALNQRWTTITSGMAKDFTLAPDVKPLLDLGSRFPTALGILQKAADGDQVAYSQVGPQMAFIFDPKARASLALMSKTGILSASVAGRIDATFERLANGQYPQDQMKQAMQDVQDAQEQIVDAVERKRQEYIQKNPEVKSRIRSTGAMMNTPPGSASKASAAAAAATGPKPPGVP